MNPRLTILAVALVLAVAAMFHLKRTAVSLAEGMDRSTGTTVPSKTERVDHDHHPDRLLTEGNIPLVTAAISQLTNQGDLAPWDTPFLELIPKIPDPATRHEIFLQAAKGVRPRDADDPFSPGPNFDQPNIAYEAVRDLAQRLDLPPDIRAQAGAAFAQLEAQEEINRAKMREEQANEPFVQ